MKKRVLIASAVLLSPIILLLALWIPILSSSHQLPGPDYRCPFCDEKVRQGQGLYDGKHLMVMANWIPIVPGTCMIIPKRHVVRVSELNADELVEFGDVVKRVQNAFQKVYNASDMLLCAQDGINAGQTVYHVHFHAIPRPEANVYTKIKLWWTMLTRPLQINYKMTPEQIKTEYAPLIEALQEQPFPQ